MSLTARDRSAGLLSWQYCQEGYGVVALILLALSVGAMNLGCRVAGRVCGDREGELLGGIAGLLTLLILGLIMFQLGLVPKRVLTSRLDCPWLRGC